MCHSCTAQCQESQMHRGENHSQLTCFPSPVVPSPCPAPPCPVFLCPCRRVDAVAQRLLSAGLISDPEAEADVFHRLALLEKQFAEARCGMHSQQPSARPEVRCWAGKRGASAYSTLGSSGVTPTVWWKPLGTRGHCIEVSVNCVATAAAAAVVLAQYSGAQGRSPAP